MIKKILVAMDGSEPSQHALNYALKSSMKWRAKLIILSVIPNIVLPAYIRARPYIAEYEEALRDAHQSELTEAVAKVKQEHPEIEVVSRLEEGRPSNAIVETAKEEDIDLIVMGSRGLGGITGWVLGSTCRARELLSWPARD